MSTVQDVEYTIGEDERPRQLPRPAGLIRGRLDFFLKPQGYFPLFLGSSAFGFSRGAQTGSVGLQ